MLAMQMYGFLRWKARLSQCVFLLHNRKNGDDPCASTWESIVTDSWDEFRYICKKGAILLLCAVKWLNHIWSCLTEEHKSLDMCAVVALEVQRVSRAGAGVWLSCFLMHSLNALAKKGDEHAWVELLTGACWFHCRIYSNNKNKFLR